MMDSNHPQIAVANGQASWQQSQIGLGRPDAPAVRASSASHLPLGSTESRGGGDVPFPLSASSSHLPSRNTDSNGYLSAPSQLSHPRTSLSSSTSSNNPDALHVQRTYQRIAEVGGIPGDGFVTGVELTRERRTEASISGYLSPLMASTSSAKSRPPDFIRKESAPAFSNLLAVNHNAYSFTKAPPQGEEAGFDPISGASSRKPSLVPSARSAEDEQQELKLLEKVDRYGFFAPTYAQHARLVLLSQKACLDLPPESSLKASTSGRRKSSGEAASGKRSKRLSLTGNPSALESPYINLPSTSSNGNSQQSSRRSSLQPNGANSHQASSSNGSPNSPSRRSFSGANQLSQAEPGNTSASSTYSAKENSRTDKWYNEMLQPDGRDAGGNIVSWKLAEGGNDEKVLLRRVCKGIPDRWRAAAWEAMVLRQRRAKGKAAQAEDSQLNRRFYVS